MSKLEPGVHTYNIADSYKYLLKDVFAEIGFLKRGHRNFVHVPMPIVNWIIGVTKLLGIKSVLTRQSIDYLNQDSVLNIDKAMNELGYSPSRNFFNSIDELGI
ncbi:MAG: hypothetical protein KF687_09960 [Cyclobacteriaceae bacterium]|nr:hypothetical protein [Cyclobacteriaceae bacterium]